MAAERCTDDVSNVNVTELTTWVRSGARAPTLGLEPTRDTPPFQRQRLTVDHLSPGFVCLLKKTPLQQTLCRRRWLVVDDKIP